MDFSWGDSRMLPWVTNVGLVTSTGPHGTNVMACEWTHMLSYAPALVGVCIGPSKATAENIKATKEFGVSLASTDHNIISSVAGGSTGREIDKMSALKELGLSFTPGKKIAAPSVDGAALQLECKLIQTVVFGDHIMFVGEVVHAPEPSGKSALIYHNHQYLAAGNEIAKPSPPQREKIRATMEKHRK